MLLTPAQAEARLTSPSNLANRFTQPKPQQPEVITLHRPGRKVEIPNLSPIERNEIAFRSRAGERQTKLAAEFDTTQARVSQIERGQDKSLDEAAIQSRLNEVKDAALDRLMQSLNLISPDKLKKERAVDLARIASNMAKVVESTSPKDAEATPIQVVVYVPELKRESGFKVVDV